MKMWLYNEGNNVSEINSVPNYCRNCSAQANGKYCPECGQETRLHVPSLGEFAHELVGHYIAVEGKLWLTVKTLLFKPGALTLDYFAGRRATYIQPLRLYLTLSVLFFALLQFSNITSFESSPSKSAATDLRVDAVAEKDNVPDFTIPALGGIGTRMNANIRHLSALPMEEQMSILTHRLIHYSPYAMFMLLPLFALYLKLLYHGTRRYYGEHFLFALHVQSFTFAMFTLLLLAPWFWIKLILSAWLIVYLPVALSRVFSYSRRATAWRWVLLMLMYGVTLLLLIAGMILLAAFSNIA